MKSPSVGDGSFKAAQAAAKQSGSKSMPQTATIDLLSCKFYPHDYRRIM
jgi:hypothetical protein